MIDIIPFDTRRDPIVVKKIIQEGSLDNIDLIIGPLYGRPIEIIKQFCLENKILMINPLSSNNKIIDDNRYSLLFKPSIKTVAEKASEFSINRFNINKNTVILYENNFQDSLIAKIYYDNLEKNGFNIIYSKSVSKDDSRLILDSLASTYEEILSDSIYDTLKNISGILIKDGRGIDKLDTAYKYIEKFYIEER
jgi:ABC-type branched-chain amino acid transport systems, periplasmic component